MGEAERTDMAHQAMRIHISTNGATCDCCGLDYPCTYRTNARDFLVDEGHLILAGPTSRRR